MKMKRRALSLLLSLAVMVTFMPMMTLSVSAASKGGKTYIVTKEKNAVGDKVSYKYNKKGLVSKAVAKWTEKDSDSDTAYTKTTSYKYNKKNRISKETTKLVEKDTYYNTDKTTGNITSPQGSVTTTTTYVTKYTYNKKGRAKKSVTTTTETKSGSYTETEKKHAFNVKNAMNDGRFVASEDWEFDPATNKYNKVYKYWSGAVNDAVDNTTTTVSYVPSGNGYKIVEEQNRTNANYTVDTDNYVVTAGAPGYKTLNTYLKSESDHENSWVTTTTYKYDKKKRVKTANSTTVETSKTVSYGDDIYYDDYTYTKAEGKYADGTSWSTTDTTPVTKEETKTSSETVKYTYDKKGHAKKVVTTDNGVSSRKAVETYGLTNYVSIGTDGVQLTVVATGADCERVVSSIKTAGTRTVTTERKPYTLVVNGTPGTPAEAKTETKTYTVRNDEDTLVQKTVDTYKYDKNGNMKSAKTSEDGKYLAEQRNEFGETLYQFVNAENIDPEDNPYQVPEELTVTVNKITKYNTKIANTVKKGSKRLKTALSVGTSKYDRETPYVSGLLSGKVTYKLKAKKFSKKKAKNVELQQWILQNGSLNGVVGL